MPGRERRRPREGARTSRRPGSRAGLARRRAAGVLLAMPALLMLALLALAPARAGAQQDVATEGALFLLLPVGARAVGQGRAVVAGVDGSESVWWNPAGLARQERREVAIHHSQPFYQTAHDAVALVIPSSLLGVLALSANLVDYGEEEQTDINGNVVGKLLTRSVVLAGSYATPIGTRLNAGITYKILQFRVDCSGPCPPSLGATATSSAVDAGAQYDLRGLVPVTLGVAVRNLGPSLQVNDRPQQDALPARLQFGARYRVRSLERRQEGLEVAVSGDLLDRLRLGRPSWMAGVDASWRRRVSVRGGVVVDRAEANSAAVGIGLRQGGAIVDVTRTFGAAPDFGEGAPTFFSLRYLF